MVDVYESLTIALIAVLAAASTVAIFVGLLGMAGQFSSSGVPPVTIRRSRRPTVHANHVRAVAIPCCCIRCVLFTTRVRPAAVRMWATP